MSTQKPPGQQPTPHQTEPTANAALGALLQHRLPGSQVRSENTQVIVGHAARQPDILITTPGHAPVMVEAEYLPAYSAEDDARKRLGLSTTIDPRPMEAVVALRYPEAVSRADDLPATLREAGLSYCILTEGDDEQPARRFPASGWLDGSVDDLADLIRLVSVPQRAVDQAAHALEMGIETVARELDAMAAVRPGISADIARLLGLSDLPQTRRMACAIIINAMTFHDHIAGMHEGVKPLHAACGPHVANPQAGVLEAWTRILAINYWPIFAIAKDLVGQLPTREATSLLRLAQQTAADVAATGVINAHDLTGRLFQRLIADRKYLATFYTLPASAALLARLAIAKLQGVDWSDAAAIGRLRVGDFACGTGALLSAVYEQIAARHERKGGHLDALHPVMMEDVLYGCDVMPAAVHITSSTLSGARPNVRYGHSRLYVMPYGRQPDTYVQAGTRASDVKIGSLELLEASSQMVLINTSDPALRTGSSGEETSDQVTADIPDAGFDLVIMNPPFTRATNHEGRHADVINPVFAAFDADPATQTAMGQQINRMAQGTCYHGNAGIASAFAALADRKLRPGGVLALVLPLSVASGLSWQGFRELLATDYTDLTVLSLAANGREMSFSSDTGMAECLVIARKRGKETPSPLAGEDRGEGEAPAQRATFVSLHRRPQGFAHASAIAKGITGCGTVRQIEDGPYDGTPLMVGDGPGGKVGNLLSVPTNGSGANWGAVRLLDYALAQTAWALADSRLWLPGQPAALDLKTAPLGEVGKLGLVDRDITGPPPRGPFTKTAPSPTATYPALWNHNAANETRMVCIPDSQLVVRQGMEAKAAEVWTTASRAHVNRDFRFNSQPLTAAITERESIGGTAWPNVTFTDARFDTAFALWCNSTLGLLLYWWHANKQHGGRGRTTIRAVESLPVLDVRTLSDAQLHTAQAIFNDFRHLDLQPAYLADADANRALLDRHVLCDLLGFDAATYDAVRRLAAKWCAEPSVHGGKGRPAGAG